MRFEHTSVLLHECIEGLNVFPTGIYVDGTLGGAGHSLEICKRLGQKGRLIGIDQDENAIAVGKERLSPYGDRVIIVRNNFVDIKNVLNQIQIAKVDGILLDLGVSSHQLDEGSRGFSYQNNADLDMRMDQRNQLSAKVIINEYSAEELYSIIKEYGEERWAKRIAQFIIEARKNKEIHTTFELVDIIKKAIPKKARMNGPHPAKRTFQAIRIEVNQELKILRQAIEDMIGVLNPGGRLCIITFHSLEDRIVKHTFKKLESPCTCPPDFPVCVCNKKPSVRIITRKPILPSDEEIEGNPRSRSAKLRIAEKI